MAEKTCCVTGHRDIPEARIAYVEQELRREVEEAIAEGYTRSTARSCSWRRLSPMRAA